MPRPLPTSWPKAAAILLALAVSALLIAWVDPRSSAIADLRVRQLAMAPLERPDIKALDEASFVATVEPFNHTGRFGVARIVFDVEDPRTADLALFIRRARDNYAVYVNANLAAPTPGIMAEQSTLHGVLPRFVRILPALLRAGPNTLDIVSARNATQAVLREVYFGPAGRLEPAFRHTQTVVHNNGEFTALIAGIVLLFALALSSLIRNPALILTVALTLALFLLRELHALWVDQPWNQTYRDVCLFLVAVWLWLSCAAFVNEWTAGSHALRRWFLIAGASATVVPFILYVPTGSVHIAYVAAAIGQSLIVLGSILFMATRLTRHYYAAPPSAWPEIAAATIGFAMGLALFSTQAAAIPALKDTFTIDSEGFTKLSALAIIVFIAVGLARHGIGIYRLASMNNETLARSVAEKERELEANHALLREQERERALADERGRIMRDVHDGIGSQLLGLLVQARAGTAKPESLSTGLQAAIDDLYLVIDSLDGVDGSLETALGTFRTRIEPKCAAAGIEIAWNVDDIGQVKALGPASVLQIYRILQEALSNAIRHGKPKRVAFTLRRDVPTGTILLSLKDDGVGFDPNEKRLGRGLANMKKRAMSIGANLQITSGETGTCVKLRLPQ